MKYNGSCHCGQIRFEVEGEVTQAMACNCSMCSRKGSLLWFVPRGQLRVLTSEENIGTTPSTTKRTFDGNPARGAAKDLNILKDLLER